MDYSIRVIRADEWERARELRLTALRDPVAHLAFLDTYEAAVERPDSFWRERTEGASESGDGRVRQFVAEAPDGQWVGTVSVLVERAGAESLFGDVPEVEQTHVVGVFVRDEARGAGVIDALFEAAAEWSWSLAEPRIGRARLYVHAENGRAQAVYRRLGYVPTGVRAALHGSADAHELEFELLRPA
ncbi:MULTISPECIES: GNAT family N-acetyltransferase [unclassified Streptomyces]|uniref:GNAT family N-acetyltransferase n=1 Tax=unclassified Streptomyces TaxID=2593676 RepID=UPI00093D7EEF|nr:GNAT family N-acetyltransferase [Streptomyces sp. CB02261]OKJ49610.1 acetyltransferase [Streptomyces sp. CB02261]